MILVHQKLPLMSTLNL